jgi:hypothetical protein
MILAALTKPLGPMTLTAGDGLASEGSARCAPEGLGDPIAGFAGEPGRLFWVFGGLGSLGGPTAVLGLGGLV